MTRYKMAEIYLPENDNSGKPLDVVHFHLQSILCDRHGGFTRIANAQGSWKKDSDTIVAEPVSIYRVRIEDNEFETSRLIELAAMLAVFAQQDVILIDTPTGGAMLVDGQGTCS